VRRRDTPKARAQEGYTPAIVQMGPTLATGWRQPQPGWLVLRGSDGPPEKNERAARLAETATIKHEPLHQGGSGRDVPAVQHARRRRAIGRCDQLGSVSRRQERSRPDFIVQARVRVGRGRPKLPFRPI
jgi:hypothetical protein